MKHIYDENPGIFAFFLDSRYLMVYPEEIISIIEFITDQVTQKTIKKEANIEFCQDLLKVRGQQTASLYSANRMSDLGPEIPVIGYY